MNGFPLPPSSEWRRITQRYDGGTCQVCAGKLTEGDLIDFHVNRGIAVHPLCQPQGRPLLMIRLPESETIDANEIAQLLYVTPRTFNKRVASGVYRNFPSPVDPLARKYRKWLRSAVMSWISDWRQNGR